jgi:hypothetical protein
MKTIEFFYPIKKGFTNFGTNISVIVNVILLTLVYFVGVGSTSLIAKLVNNHFLSLNKPKPGKTYWANLNLRRKDLKDYFKQY